MKTSSPFFCLLIAGLAAACAGVPNPQHDVLETASSEHPHRFPSDAYIKSLLQEAIPNGCSCGLLVGIVDPDGTQRVIAYGDDGLDGKPLDAQSVLEIGSLTKVFTGVLLADMVRRGEVGLMDPVERLLPPGTSVPSRSGKKITLLDLATHTSGLPAMPNNFPTGDAVKAYGGYTVEEIYEFLATHELRREPGEVYEYSNLLSILGHALASEAGMPYGALLRERVLSPLDMQDTGITLTPNMERRMTRGHSAAGDPAPYFEAPAFGPSGGLRSTMADMLRFAAANLTDAETAVHLALRDARRPYKLVNDSEESVGLAWGTDSQGMMAGHSGGTFGYSSFINIDTRARRAIVVMANFAGRDATRIGVHLLEPENYSRRQSR